MFYVINTYPEILEVLSGQRGQTVSVGPASQVRILPPPNSLHDAGMVQW